MGFNLNVKNNDCAEGLILELDNLRVKFVNDEFVADRDNEWKEIDAQRNVKRKVKKDIARELGWDVMYNVSKAREKIAEQMLINGPGIDKNKILIDDIMKENKCGLQHILDTFTSADQDILFVSHNLTTVKKAVEFFVNY